jgi:hypothetical protein
MAACDGPVQFHRVLNRLSLEAPRREQEDPERRQQQRDGIMRAGDTPAEETGDKTEQPNRKADNDENDGPKNPRFYILSQLTEHSTESQKVQIT